MQPRRTIGLTLAILGVATLAASAQPYIFGTDFDAIEGYVPGDEVLLQQPEFSGSTTGIITGATTGGAPYTPAQVVQWGTADGGDADMEDQAYEIAFPWQTPAENAMTSGVRCTTSSVLNLPLPSIDLTGIVRFKIAVTAFEYAGDANPDFPFGAQDLSQHPSILVCLAIRETGRALPQGAEDTGGGDLEYVYVPGSDIIPTADTNGLISFPPGGKRYNATNDVWPPQNAFFQDFIIDLGNIDSNSIRGFANNGDGVNTAGDGVLDATLNPTGHGVNRGVLEAIIFTNDPADDTGGAPGEYFFIYVDDIEIESQLEDPTPPPTVTGPITRGDTTVTVTDISTNASEVRLIVDNGSDPDQIFNPVSEVTSHVFTLPHGADAGDTYTATQTVDTKESVVSPGVTVTFPGPVIGLLPKDGDTTVRITGIDPLADEVELFVNGGSRGVTMTTNGVFTIDVPSGSSLDMGEEVTATQTVTGAISDLSPVAVVTTNGVVSLFCDDFEYANQTAFDAAWAPTSGDLQLELSEAQNATDGGSKSAFSSTSGEHRSGLITEFTPTPGSDTHPVIWNVSVWQDAVYPRQYTEVRGAGQSTSPLIAMGGYNALTGNYFNARIPGYTVENAQGWFLLDGFEQPTKTPGWHVLTMAFKASTCDFYVDGALAALNIPHNAAHQIATVLIGSGLTSAAGVSYYDDVCVKVGALHFNTIGNQPPPPPTVVEPILPLATSVTVIDISTNAVQVSLHKNGSDTPVVTPIDPADATTVSFTIPSAVGGDFYTAKQTVGTLTSPHSDPVYVQLPGPVLYKAPADGEASVRVLAIHPDADLVEVLVGPTVRGSIDPNGATDIVVPLTAYTLSMGEVVTARMTVGPTQSVPSATETVTTDTVSATMLCDDFESYTDQTAFEVVYEAVNFTASPNETIHEFTDVANATSNGSATNSVRSRTGAQYRTTPKGNPLPPLTPTDTQPLVFNVTIWDPTAEPGTDEWASLVDWTTLGGGPGFFLTEIGMATGNFTSGPETHYQGRLAGNGGPGWFQLDQYDGPTRSPGWHAFTVVIKGPRDGNANGNEADMYVDGLLSAKNVLLTTDTSVYTPLIGSGQTSSDGAWYDDFCAQLGPVRFNEVQPEECVTLAGDADKDGDVDLDDVDRFTQCLDDNGPDAVFYPAGCSCADVDGNLHIDLVDFAKLQELF